MLVITLIVLGFAEVASSDQRTSLDSQLGTQAYYAAESGINAVIQGINSFYAWQRTSGNVGATANPPAYSIDPNGLVTTAEEMGADYYDYTNLCLGSKIPSALVGSGTIYGNGNDINSVTGKPITLSGESYYYNHSLSSSYNVAYSCVNIGNQSSSSFDDLQPGEDRVNQICPNNTCTLPGMGHTLQIGWSNSDTPPSTISSSCTDSSTFYSSLTATTGTPWKCNIGVIRVDYFQTSQADLDSHNGNYTNLQNATTTLYLYPTLNPTAAHPDSCTYYAGGTTGSPTCYGGTSSENGMILDGNCYDSTGNPSPFCEVTINNISGSGYIRIMPLYVTSNVDLYDHLGGSSEQLQIESTGKAQNITRRVSANISLLQAPSGANYALQTTESICKDYATDYQPYSGSPSFFWATGINSSSYPGCGYD